MATPKTCPECGGPLKRMKGLGGIGHRNTYKCQDCGWKKTTRKLTEIAQKVADEVNRKMDEAMNR